MFEFGDARFADERFGDGFKRVGDTVAEAGDRFRVVGPFLQGRAERGGGTREGLEDFVVCGGGRTGEVL